MHAEPTSPRRFYDAGLRRRESSLRDTDAVRRSDEA
jgi:hypothetical protein